MGAVVEINMLLNMILRSISWKRNIYLSFTEYWPYSLKTKRVSTPKSNNTQAPN